MGRDISFLTVNLLNLQVPNTPTRPGAATFTPEQYRARIAWLRDRLEEADADIIGFQELWSAAALNDLFAGGALNDRYELRLIKDNWYDIAVAAAVRKSWTVTAQTVHKDFPAECRLVKRRHGTDGADADREDDEVDVRIDRFSRSVLQLDVRSADNAAVPEISVYVTHLKSKLGTRLDRAEQSDPSIAAHSVALGAALSTIRRTAEAAALRVILNKAMRGNDRPVVLLGDLNDGDDSNTLAILTEQPGYRFYYSSRSGNSSDRGLYSCSYLQALSDFRDVSYSHLYKGRREMLDHVLVSEQFYDYSKKAVWTFRDQRIWNDQLVEDRPSGNASRATDHGLVRARFNWKSS